MKKLLLITLLLSSMNCAYAYYSPLDGIYGVTNIVRTKSEIENTKNTIKNENLKTEAILKNINAQTKCIEEGRCTNTNLNPYPYNPEYAQNFDPDSPEAKMGLKMAEALANHYERKNAKAKLKEIKNIAKIENDTHTLEIIKKYKKAGAIVTLQKIEEAKNAQYQK